VLDADGDGFFLMVEGGAVDWASHANQAGRTIEEQVDFNKAVDAVLRWVRDNSDWGDTLVIVTGDHETGYLWGPGTGADALGYGVWKPLVNNGAEVQPGMQFNSGDHTNSLIPFFAKGDGANELRKAATASDPVRGAYLDNTDIAKVILSEMR
jgi:alkaline phosphatase